MIPTNGRRHRLRKTAEEEAHRLDEDDAETEGDEKLVLVGARIKIADDQPLHQHADQHHEQRAGDHRDDERAGIGVGDPAGIAAQHEHRAMREVEHAKHAVDDRQPRGDQREQRAEHQPVETLRDEIRPVDHAPAPRPIIRLRRRALIMTGNSPIGESATQIPKARGLVAFISCSGRRPAKKPVPRHRRGEGLAPRQV